MQRGHYYSTDIIIMEASLSIGQWFGHFSTADSSTVLHLELTVTKQATGICLVGDKKLSVQNA